MRPEPSPMRVAIAGASSLRGKELKEVLEGGSFAAAEIRLLDEENVAGTLTEAGGEPVVIQTVDEESFAHVRFAFFAGEASFAAAHWRAAQKAGATVIDLSGGLADVQGARPWIVALDDVLPRPATASAKEQAVYLSPPAPVIVACSITAALQEFGVERLVIVFLQPVSERGQAGIEELESQTVRLLSFQPIGQKVFGAQVAFNLLDRYGAESPEKLSDARAAVTSAVRCYLEGRATPPAIQIVQAPVFHSTAFSIHAELRSAIDADAVARAAESVGLRVAAADEAPTNVSVAGESKPVIGRIEPDGNAASGWWLWGAADNLRVSAANAAAIAEKLLEQGSGS